MDDAVTMVARVAFLAIAIAGMTYFLLRKRIFDFCSLAFFGACFYFLPGFLGFVGYAEGVVLTPVTPAPGTYMVMSWVLMSIIGFGVLVDAMKSDAGSRASRPRPALRFVAEVSTAAAVAGFLLTCATMGTALLNPDKVALLAELNRWHLLWTTGAVLGLSVSYLRGARTLCIVNLLMLLANLYVGFRVDLVIAVLVVSTLALNRRGPIRLVDHWRVGLIVVFFGLALFAYKYVLFALKNLDADLLVAQVRNPDAFKFIFLYSEPFVAQGTLNEVIRQNFFVGADHLRSVFMLFVPFANELGAEVIGFNDLFQPALFSSVTEYGLGSNIWAEMIAVGGWTAIGCFTAAFGVLVASSSRVLNRFDPVLTALLATVTVYWAFYVHRNDLLYQLTLTRRVVLAWVTFAVISMALDAFVRQLRRLAIGSSANEPDKAERVS